MKKFLMAVVVVLLLAGCAGEEGNNHNQKDDNNTPDNQTAEAKNSSDNNTNADETTVNISLKDIEIRIHDKRDVRIQGKVKTTNNRAYYRILHDEEIVGETQLDLDKEGWTEIDLDLTLPESVVKTDQVPVLELYAKNENGREINPNYFAIDFVRQSF